MPISPLLKSNILCSASRNRRDLLHPIYRNLSPITFDPLTTPNLVSAFEAETGVYTTTSRTTLSGDTDAAASWTDQINGWNAENANADTTVPTFKTSIINNLPVIQSTPANSTFLQGNTNTGITGTSLFSMSFTFKLLATTQYGSIIGIGGIGGSGAMECLFQQNSNSNTLYLNTNSGAGGALATATGKNFTTGFHVCSAIYDGTDLKYYIDGILTDTMTLTFNLDTGPVTMFAQLNQSQPGSVQLQSAWLANAAWADADREALENYQSQKCGGLF